MAIIGKFENGTLLVREAVAGPASYATATPPEITFSDLSQIDEILSLTIDSGHVVNQSAIALQVVDVRVRGLDAAGMSDGDPMLEITDGIDLSAFTIIGLAVGR